MNPETNKTLYDLCTLEHEISDIMQNAMYKIVDNGDRADKRIEAIIGLHYVIIATNNKLSKLTQTIPESK